MWQYKRDEFNRCDGFYDRIFAKRRYNKASFETAARGDLLPGVNKLLYTRVRQQYNGRYVYSKINIAKEEIKFQNILGGGKSIRTAPRVALSPIRVTYIIWMIYIIYTGRGEKTRLSFCHYFSRNIIHTLQIYTWYITYIYIAITWRARDLYI